MLVSYLQNLYYSFGQNRVDSDVLSDYEVSESSDGKCLDYASPLTSISALSSPQYSPRSKTIHYIYPDCDKTFNRPARLEQHICLHINIRRYVCLHPPCTKAFFCNSHLHYHVILAYSKVRKYVCIQAGYGKSFVTGTKLKRHAAVHEGQYRFGGNVVGCRKSFWKHGTLYKHVTVVHEWKNLFICQAQDDDSEICNAGFDSAWKLRSNEARLHGSKRFWCIVCSSNGPEIVEESAEQEIEGAVFSTYTDLQAHIRINHPHTCLEFGQPCASQYGLKKHIEAKHSFQDGGASNAYLSKAGIQTGLHQGEYSHHANLDGPLWKTICLRCRRPQKAEQSRTLRRSWCMWDFIYLEIKLRRSRLHCTSGFTAPTKIKMHHRRGWYRQ